MNNQELQEAIAAERQAKDAFVCFLEQNKGLLQVIAGWGDGECGYLRDLCREVLLGRKDEDPKSVTQVNRGASISGKKRWAVFKRDGYACVACGADSDLTIDHIHPQSKGGGNQFDNLQTLCRKCNTKKGASTNAV